jgi:hypothetical protein
MNAALASETSTSLPAGEEQMKGMGIGAMRLRKARKSIM